MSDPYQPENKRQRRSDPKEELLFQVARGYLGLAARQRAIESVSFITTEVWSGDTAIGAVRAVGKKNHENVKAARAQNKTYKSPFPLSVLQYLACCEDLVKRDESGKLQTYCTAVRGNMEAAGMEIRYFRVLKCFDKQKAKIQLNLGGAALDAWKIALAILKKDTVRTKIYQGQAPRNDKERAVLKLLKEFGEIKENDDEWWA